jgi:Kef-type K+ transport system membrane component KefB
VPFIGFALFMGAAMSITAFPVLARILVERDMLNTKVGALAIACAAVDDVSAWCILAVVIAIVRAGQATFPIWITIGGSLLFVAAMVIAVRPVLRQLSTRRQRAGRLSEDMTALILLLVLAAAWTTEWLGIHALFGAFVLGAVMPKDHDFVHEITEKLQHITVTFLLPIFFALAGLRASIGSLNGLAAWFYFGLILFVAVLGKFGGSAVAAHWTGLSWREASTVGSLMNTRGLVELVILNIGFDLGVISPTLYTMMVLMALLTTFMTSPILERLYPKRLRQQEVVYLGDGASY